MRPADTQTLLRHSIDATGKNTTTADLQRTV